MKITIQIKSIYGTDTIYPACETSKIFAELLKQKTLTYKNLDLIKKLGYTIEVKANHPSKL